MRPRISIRRSVRPSVRPSVGPLPLLENQFLALFSGKDVMYQVVRMICEPHLILCLHLSVRPSLAPKSIHAETQSGRIVACSGLFDVFSTHVNVCYHITA